MFIRDFRSFIWTDSGNVLSTYNRFGEIKWLISKELLVLDKNTWNQWSVCRGKMNIKWIISVE